MRAHEEEISHLGPRDVRPYRASGSAADAQDLMANLDLFGINLDHRHVNEMFRQAQSDPSLMGMDAALIPAITTPSIGTPIQFLQEWLAGLVYISTDARKIDELVGVTVQGRWEDEEVVQGVLERVGKARVYADTTNLPLADWNVNFERRTVVRHEQGLSVGRLQSARSAAMRVDNAQSKRSAAMESLEISRNRIGFNGFNNGANRTFGFLNDPELPGYVTAAAGAAGPTTWVSKTFLEIVADIRQMQQALRTQSGDRIDPEKDKITLAVSTAVVDSLNLSSTFGQVSVRDWLRKSYPNTRVESAPELNAANGGANVAYLYAEGVLDESTDDRRTWVQVVPSKFYSLGVQQRVKDYVEGFSNATAGLMVKRPWAVFRLSGI